MVGGTPDSGRLRVELVSLQMYVCQYPIKVVLIS